jgi:polyisoprenoid-binding protein YceI
MDKGAKSHEGTVKIAEGSFTLLEDSITAASLTINVSSATESTNNAKFLGHLATPDLLDFVGFPTSSFTFERHEADTVYGSLSLAGKTMAVKAPVTVADGQVTLGDFKVDMSELTFFVTEKTKVKKQEEWHDANIGLTGTIVGVAVANDVAAGE